ncbi:hypothetical protein GCM10010394_47520 [Streptomyces crystallinus]|uniref:Uncharacterized protein n=2 Tax=Streptomyces crystallinus TaxID=68191 RepID=A0ABP3RKK0_9ACTN
MTRDPLPAHPGQRANQSAHRHEGPIPPLIALAQGAPVAAKAAEEERLFISLRGQSVTRPVSAARVSELRRDIELAHRLARMRPRSELAAGVRSRLAAHIKALLPTAQAAAEALPCDTRARDVALSVVHQAAELAGRPGRGDQAAMLTLLATSATFLSRYAACSDTAAGAPSASHPTGRTP